MSGKVARFDGNHKIEATDNFIGFTRETINEPAYTYKQIIFIQK